jgi:hypothetical protein
MYEAERECKQSKTVIEPLPFEDFTSLLSKLGISINLSIPRTEFEDYGDFIKLPSKLHTKGEGKPIDYYPSTGSCWCWKCSVRFKREWGEDVRLRKR